MPYFCNPLPKLLQISVIIKKISIDFSYLIKKRQCPLEHCLFIFHYFYAIFYLSFIREHPFIAHPMGYNPTHPGYSCKQDG